MPEWAWWVVIVICGSIIVSWITKAIQRGREIRNEEIAQRVVEKLKGPQEEYDDSGLDFSDDE